MTRNNAQGHNNNTINTVPLFATLTVIATIPDTDLRTIQWNRRTLSLLMKTHKLREGEAVCFIGRAGNKMRWVAVIEGVPMLILPPTDNENVRKQFQQNANVTFTLSTQTAKAVLQALVNEITPLR
jgi:hypothetical protein